MVSQARALAPRGAAGTSRDAIRPPIPRARDVGPHSVLGVIQTETEVEGGEAIMLTQEIYEAPALAEIGDFEELTLGVPWWCPYDWFGIGYVIGC
jgi:hypothetical protein